MSAPVVVVPVDYLEELVSTLMAVRDELLEYSDSLGNGGEHDASFNVAVLARSVRQFADDLEDEGTFPRMELGVPA